ncbi:hypothetical protein EXT42_08580 [Pseudoalteromonas sp. CO302Y]|nr:hypothetical protein EXT42_08580 [Pseudoalteromonas sp. CO302Y]RZG09915.1 hypothetical protein EXT40_08590 [Pseudoalteromonas sp. CO133X]
MINLLKSISVILQCFLLLSIFNLLSSFYLAYVELPTNDPKLIASHISSGVVISLIQVVPALIGLLLSIWLLDKTNTSKLFRKCCKYLAFLWLLFFPIGTFLGVKQLKRFKNT